MKVLAVGGGSGGHVTPVVAVIDQLHAKQPDVQIRFVCDKAFESQARGLMEHASTPVKVSIISAGKFRRYSHLTFWQHFTVPHVVIKNTLDTLKIAWGFVQSMWLLIRDRPDVVFAKGGYVCLPLGVAAWMLRIPLVIHDSDSRPGLTNRVLARFARKIGTGTPLKNYNYDPKKSTYVGVPIADTFRPVTLQQQREFKVQLGYDADAIVVVATGGGLGAPTINTAVRSAAAEMDDTHVQFYNVTGKKHFEAALSASGGLLNYTAVPFVYEHMDRVLGAADVVVSRASATFLQELAGLEKAVIAVPARQLGDQLKNAAVYKAANAAVVLTDADLAVDHRLADELRLLINDAEARKTMAASLHAFAKPSAAFDVADMIIDAVN